MKTYTTATTEDGRATHLLADGQTIAIYVAADHAETAAMAADLMRAAEPPTKDLGMLICRWAEREASRAKMPIWAKVQEITGTGATLAARFCAEHLPKLGWSRIKPGVHPDGYLMLTVEDLGDCPRKLKRMNGRWYDKNGNIMQYSPSWWKEIR